MEEIWNIGIFLQIAIIENIAEVCSKIYASQMQKYRVENMVERIIEGKARGEQKFLADTTYRSSKFGFGEMKYPFIEYMSYRLKKLGKKAYGYLDVLEEQVEKLGTTVSDVIKKEHFDIALKKITIGNGITSIKEINRINFLEIFEKVNSVEEVLKKDPANVYEKMDYKTKEYYRNVIKEIAKKTKISEMYIAQKLIELAEQAEDERKRHIGYYLITEGKNELWEKLGFHKKQVDKNRKVNYYIIGIYSITIILAFLGAWQIGTYHLGWGILFFFLLFIPLTEIVTQVIQYGMNKIVKPKLIPKLDMEIGIDQENTTIVVIPTIIKNKEKVKRLFEQLEVYYLANESDNLYFALLGDCESSTKEQEEYDEEVIQQGILCAKELNEKYPSETIPRFHFLYRKRRWNEGENSYLGWERKRGLLNQFNEFLLKKEKHDFIVNTLENEELPKIKYVITLDADTDLILNSAFELIGAMSHILNKPILDEENRIINGHALIQPKVGIDLISSRKTLFTRLFAGAGGTDLYTNAISDTYQDNFEEGIFTGKGIYDLSVFETVLKDEIPENIVLSHDLLEGSYLRCGLASDILLMDGYPCKYNSFMQRLHRWIRGDWQITRWLFPNIRNKDGTKRKNPLNFLSRYKIWDNLRRSLVEVASILSIFILLLYYNFYQTSIKFPLIIVILSVISPMVLEIINRIIYRKEGETYQRTFSPVIQGWIGSLYRAILSLAFLPDKAYRSVDAIIRTIYRKKVTKKHLLEWTTAEEAEKNAKTDYYSYYTTMLVNPILGIFILLLTIASSSIFLKTIGIVLGFLWIIGPAIACYISKEQKIQKKLSLLDEKEQNYMLEIARKTWNYFKENLTEKNNYLPPDNYQENRKQKLVYRTSSTNIGLALLAVVSSYDLEFENLEDTISLIERILNTIEKLSKWNGHLYNWYEIRTLEPLVPRYISTVDSGNFVGYLYVLKQFLIENREKVQDQEKVRQMISIIDKLIQQTDFNVLYDKEKRIFSIGFNIEENKLTESYYDLLASEARQASLVAISKKDVPVKHWNNLSRTLTNLNRYQGLISWSGTAFEYLMPNVNIKTYPGSLMDESCRFLIMSQIAYSNKIGIPWGISEAAFNLKDLNGNYQYKAFGIPWLGLKRGLADEAVVSSYGSVLAIPYYPKEVVENIRRLEKEGIMGKYGMYEAIDYTSSRLKYGEKRAVVKTFMAHHQGLILLSINNLFNEQVLQDRFFNNPEIKAIDILLQERMPEKVILTKEKKEKPEKLKYKDYESYSERVYTKTEESIDNVNVISNEEYTILMNQKGESYSKYQNVYINRYKETADVDQGIFFYIKNINSKRIWTVNAMRYLPSADKYQIHFMPDSNRINRIDGDIETDLKVTIAPNEPIEIRKLELTNHGNQEETIEITSYFEPILSTKEQDTSHMTFNNLFLRYEKEEETNSIIVERRKRTEEEKDIFLGVNFYTEKETIGELEYEIDREKFYGRANLNLPQMVQNSKTLSKKIGFVTDPAIAIKRTVRIKPGETIELTLILAASHKKEEVKEAIKEYQNGEKIKKVFELAKVRAMEEARYLGLKGKEIEEAQEILSLLLEPNPVKMLDRKLDTEIVYSQSDLWKFGISGDYPILLVKIKDANDIYIIENLLKIYEFLKVKNIMIEFVILNQEKYSYEQYVKEAIENAILNQHLAHMKNARGGIFVLQRNELSQEDRAMIEYTANLIIDSKLGNIFSQIEQKKEEYENSIPKIGNEEPKQIIIEEEKIRGTDLEKMEDMEKVKYYNEYGAFSEDGREYIIKVNQDELLPTVWSHILANPRFGTIVTEGMGGYTWNENSRLNRVTAWNNNPTTDIPSEVIYITELDTGKAWSLGSRPMPDKNDYYIRYGFGYAKYEHTSLGIRQENEIFVPLEDSIKINLISLKNITPHKKKMKLFYYLKPVLGEDEINTNGNIEVKKEGNMVYAKNYYHNEKKNQVLYVGCNETIGSFTGRKKTFFGQGGPQNPQSIHKVSLDNNSGLGEESCVAIELEIELQEYEKREIILFLGEEENLLDAKNIAYKYSNIGNCKQELEKVKQYWYRLLNKVQIQTPVESFQILLNGWIPYQIITSRLYGKTGYYQSGGAIGYRDQLQDTLGLKYIDIRFMKEQIIEQSKHQFIEGDVEHWWHEETKKGIRTRFSDDRLWLPYLVIQYIHYTGDKEILNIKTPYIKGNAVEEGKVERYDLYIPAEVEESIYEHCIRAIEISLDFGENGLPKIGSGDWNDGFSNVGCKGKGESVWVGFFLYRILDQFLEYVKEKKEGSRVEKYETILQNLKRALNKNAWDGRWYKRAFTDNGEVLGSIENEECRIDSIAQSWSVISEAADNDKKYISMESLENHLVDKENGIIKLLDPPFDKGKLQPGYIKSYLPGVRENGGQYTHASIWAIIAEAKLGFGDKAVEFFRMINPIEHSKTKEAAQKYKVEPYVIAADVYGSGNLIGRGGWTWYTGSASWLYEAGVEYILGLKIENGILRIEPCIAKEWNEYSIRYRYGNTIYHIKVKNPDRKNTGITKFKVNGEIREEKQIRLVDDGKNYEIEIIM